MSNGASFKNIYILLGIGGLFVFISESFYLFADPFSWSGWWAANVLHTLGGVYAFFFCRALWLYMKSFNKMEIPLPIEIMIWIGGALIVGVFWEWYEFILDRYGVWVLGNVSLATYADNIGDLLIDFFGALLAGIYYWRKQLR